MASDTLKQIADNLGVTTINGNYLSGIADYYGVDLATSDDLMADILTEVGGNPANSTDYLQDIVLALGGTVTINGNWMEAWEAITAVPAAPVNTVAPVISGTDTLGSVLTTTDGTWTNSPTSFAYQWKRGATNIGTNANTYTLVVADSSADITCEVTATNAGGSTPATSNIITADNYTPVCVFAPVISGSTSVGSTLTVTDNGTWTGDPTPAFSYQWKRGATNIGTNATTYILVVADTNENITCVVTGTNAIGSGNASSNLITVDNPFISTFRTTAPSETVTLPYEVAGTYSGTIDWGDATTSTNSYANRAHVYLIASDYVITVTGVTTGFRFNNSGDKIKIRNIINWGTLRLGNNSHYFYGCTNLTLTTVNGILNLTGTTSFTQMFRGCSSLTTVANISSWNTAGILSMSNCFSEGAFNSNISSWNTGAVTNMEAMFASNLSFNQNLGSWNVANVTNFANFMLNKTAATFSTANLDAIYNGWSASGVKPNKTITFGGAKFTNAGGLAGKTLLLAAPNNWTITDGGGI